MAKISGSQYSIISLPKSLPTLRLSTKTWVNLPKKETANSMPEKHINICTMCRQQLSRRTSINHEGVIHTKGNLRTQFCDDKTQFRKKMSQLKPDPVRNLEILLGNNTEECGPSSNTHFGDFLAILNVSKPSKLREISEKVQAKILRKKSSKHTISAPILVTASSIIGTIPIQYPAKELAFSQRPLNSGEKRAARLLSMSKYDTAPKFTKDIHERTALPRMTCELRSTQENVRALGISSFNEFYKPRYAVDTPFSTTHQECLSPFSSSGSRELIDGSEISPFMSHCEGQGILLLDAI